MTKQAAGIIQYADGTYHAGGIVYVRPVKNIYAAKTYVSPKKAQSVLNILVKNHPCNATHGAKVLPVGFIILGDLGQDGAFVES